MPRPGSMMVQIMVSVLASMGSIVRGGVSRMEGDYMVIGGLTEDIVGAGKVDEVFDPD
jgi:hypothetical protein